MTFSRQFLCVLTRTLFINYFHYLYCICDYSSVSWRLLEGSVGNGYFFGEYNRYRLISHLMKTLVRVRVK